MLSRYQQDSAGQVYILSQATKGAQRVFRCENGFVEEFHGKEGWSKVRLVSNQHRSLRCAAPADLLKVVERWHKATTAQFQSKVAAYLHHSRGA